MEILAILSGLVASAFLAGGVLALAGLGETVTQRAGVFNLGIEGFMAMGGIAAIATVAATESVLLGSLAAAAIGLLFGLMFATTTVILRVNQVVSGLAFTFLGSGLAAWVGTSYAGKPAEAAFEKVALPGLSQIPLFGDMLFNHQTPIYLAFFILPVALHLVLFRTRFGLSLLAVGENPGAADATGIAVVPMRMGCVTFGCIMASLAGAYLTLVFVPSWSEGMTAGRGWIAIALVIFAAYRPIRVALAAFFFGLITAFGFTAQTWGWTVPSAFLSSLPYLATLVIMTIPVWIVLKGKRTDRPAALGIPYFREER
jgi:simple sugar transport system permease protein